MAPKIFLCILFVAVLLASEATSGTMAEVPEMKVCSKRHGKCPDNKVCSAYCIERNYQRGQCEGLSCCCFIHD
ncbi:uncharacterized protein DS421_2g57280 [Arachis hypogaea]|nr:uncharacterized protein DS421_2g57280 [Arachis hypogaea]